VGPVKQLSGEEADMRLNAIDITPIQVTITTEEILADLTYPGTGLDGR
jgi:hypothetical protein